MNDVWHLRSVDWLQELTREETDDLLAGALPRDYAAGETVFEPESHPHSLYLLERGLVRIYRLSGEGAETTFGYVAAGEVFGELTAFGDYPRESFAATVRASRVWKIPAERFRKLLERRPGLVLAVTRQIGARLKRIESRVEDLVFRDVRARVARMLLELAEDFGVPDGDRIVINVDLTQAEFATLVGATRQTVNATLRHFENEKLTQRTGRRIGLLREAELKRIADGDSTISGPAAE